jgi:hypothetical protein
MKRLAVSFLLLILFICFSCRSDNVAGTKQVAPIGESLYLNSIDGDDNNTGTRGRPLKTINEVNKRIQGNPAKLFFHGGQTFSGTLQMKNISSLKNTYLIIDSYSKGLALIDGGEHEAIRIEGCRKMIIRNINIKGDGRKTGNICNGLAIIDSRDCIIENIQVEGFQKSGIDLYNCRNMKVRRIYSHDNGFCGINVMGSEKHLSGNILVQSCKAENNPGDPTILDNHSGNGILVGVSDSVIIEYCTATNNGWDMPRPGNGPVGIWAWMSDHVRIQYCISYRNKTSKGAKDGGGFDLDGGVTNSVIQFCISYDNQGAGYGLFQYPGASDWSDNIIRYCISMNDAHTTVGSASFFIWNGSDERRQLRDCRIHNNIVFNSYAPVISFENASLHEDFVFSHNLFMGSGDLISGKNTGSTYRGNLWIGKKGEGETQ